MKKNITELAVFGGAPLFETPLHVGRPNAGDRAYFLEQVNGIFDRRWFSNNGPIVQKFEKDLSHLLGVKHCIATCNATTGLEIAIRALGLTGEVLVPSFTFVATVHALQWQGITPVFVDIDPLTHNIDPEKIEARMTSKTTGILGVHVWGRPCHVERLIAIAQAHGLKLLFDAAHALGSTHKGVSIGNFGQSEVFSFHATKFLNTFEGGMIATNDDDLADRIRLMVNFGFSGYDHVVSLGTNGKMSEVSAAMGLTGLRSWAHFLQVNRTNYEAYTAGLQGVSGLKLIAYPLEEKNNFQYVVLEVDAQQTGLTRDHILKCLAAENILARRYFYPGCHRMEPYRSLQPDASQYLPETERLVQEILCLPTGTAVELQDISSVCNLLRFLIANAEHVVKRFGAQVEGRTLQVSP